MKCLLFNICNAYEIISISIHTCPALKLMEVSASNPLELLDTDQAIIALHSHGVDQLIWTIHLSH